jgi:hypothetical protein
MDIEVLITLIIASLALLVSVYNLKKFEEQNSIGTFTEILKEVANDSARKDRALVKQIRKENNGVITRKEIELLIKAGRGTELGTNKEIGQAIEATIARLDRVGFFLLANKKTPRIDPPIWLWTITDDMWNILGDWIIFRQDNKSKEYYHKGYGFYFQKMVNIESNKRKSAT